MADTARLEVISPTGSDKVNDGDRGVLALQRVLYHHSAQLVLRREVLHLAVAQLAHEGGFARAVRAEDAVTAAAVELEMRVREQQEGAIGEREDGVAEQLAFAVIYILNGSVLCLRDRVRASFKTNGMFTHLLNRMEMFAHFLGEGSTLIGTT